LTGCASAPVICRFKFSKHNAFAAMARSKSH
jgi:hypothetical protein